jgi:hypothetical protein
MNHTSNKFFSRAIILLCILNIHFFTFSSVYPVNAQINSKSLPVSVMPILPDNQKDGVKGYFHLYVESGEEQQLYVKIHNPTNQDQIVDIAPANALTAQNGGIIYVSQNNSQHVGLIDEHYALNKHIQVDSEVTIDANSTLKVPVTITVPKGDVGTFLGGLLFNVKSSNGIQETNPNTNKATFSITNRFVYAMAIQLDLPEPATPSFVLGNVNIETYPAEPKLLIHMRNESPMILRNVSGDYQVINSNGQTLFSGELEPFMMAPKSTINYPVNWNYKTMEPGHYSIILKMKVNGQTMIETEKAFEIKNENMQTYQDALVQPVLISHDISWWTWILGGVLVFALLLIGFWLGKRNNTNGALNEHTKKPRGIY